MIIWESHFLGPLVRACDVPFGPETCEKDILDFIHKLKAENEKLKSEVVTLQASEAENEDWQLAARSADWSETPEELCTYLTYCGDPDEYNQLLRENKELEEENKKQEDVIKKLGETIRELLPNDPHEADKYLDIAYGEDPH
tara:strand:- start:396 stop:821 length:426 start_codon:yes stop_codon:yes gene_type:complete